ncbi:MAG TPA: hypothetical protein VF534_38650 [Paraburkholderia sp.]
MSHTPTSSRGAALIVVPGIPRGRDGLAGGLWAISVRCPTGRLRVATMWQLIRPYASRLIRTRTRSDRKVGYEELSFIFAGVPDETLPAMVDYLAAQPWVLDAWFVP